MRREREEEGRSKKRRFQYRETDAGDARRVASGGGQYDSIVKANVKQWKCGEGKQTVRILPRTWDDDAGPRHWGFEAFVHYGVGADNSTYLCPQKMKGDTCPICEERAEVVGKDEQAAKDLRAAKVVLVWIIDRRNAGEGPQLWRMPAQKVAQEIMERSDDPETGRLLRVDHPEKGYDISFRKEGSQRNTDYVGVAIARRPSPLSENEDEMEEWLAFVTKNPIPSVLNFYDEDHLNKVFGGGAAKDDDEDDDEDEKPAKKGKARKEVEEDDEDEPPRRGKAAREEDDEDDEEEAPRRGKASRDDDDEDEEDEEEPAKKSKAKASRDDDDEDEEDDDIEDIDEPDDDEEDDAPAKGERRRGTRDDDEDDDEDEAPPSKAKSVRDSVSGGLKRRRRD